tara:strand:- start:1076 stop:2080 length:1005 start_codon:yes stop_codon:yes gene_type:complete
MTKYIKGRWYESRVIGSGCFYRCTTPIEDNLFYCDMAVRNGDMDAHTFYMSRETFQEVDPNTVLNSINLKGKTKEEILEVAKVFFYEGVVVEIGLEKRTLKGNLHNGGMFSSIYDKSAKWSMVYGVTTEEWAEILSTPEGWWKNDLHCPPNLTNIAGCDPYKGDSLTAAALAIMAKEFNTDKIKEQEKLNKMKKQQATKENMRVFLSLTKSCSAWQIRLNNIMLRGYKQDALRDSFEWEDSEVELAFKQASDTQRKALEKVFKLDDEFKVGDNVLIIAGGVAPISLRVCSTVLPNRFTPSYFLVGNYTASVFNNCYVDSLRNIKNISTYKIIKA